MKKSYFVQKSLGFILFTAASFFVSPNLYAQRESFTDDQLAGSLTGTSNTGTDVMIDEEAGGRIQVMVADGAGSNDNILYWDVAGNTGSLVFDSSAPAGSDPDVVVGKRDGRIYALVVYINASKQVGWQSFIWSGANFDPADSGTLGFGESGGYHGCASPNIDVNNEGQVAVVWAESYTVQQVISHNPTSGEAHSFNQTVSISRGDIWTAYGFIDGTSPSGAPSTSLKGYTNNSGDKVSRFDKYLFEKNTQPDVAIADMNRETAVVTYTYLQNYMADDYSNGTYLMAQRGTWNAPVTYTFPLGNYISVNGSGAPRIASRKSVANENDFEIVLAIPTHLTACGNSPARTTGTVFNYGVYSGTVHGVDPKMIVNDDLVGTNNFEPVVTYDAGAWRTDANGDFIVTWTTSSNCPPIADNGLNVISRTMTHPTASTVTYLYDNYSFANKGNLNAPQRDTRGDQEIPSVAGVYLDNGSVYFFKDTYGGNMLYKHSTGLDGRENLRVANVTVTSYPNPFQKQATFKINVPANDLAQELVIYDIKGTALAQIKLKEVSGLQEVTWKPGRKLMQGMYFARILTLKDAQTIKVVNQD